MKTNKKNIRIGAIVALVLLSFMTLSQITSVQAFGANVSGTVTCDSTAVNNVLVSLIVDDVVEDTDYTDANGDYFVLLRDLLTSTIPCTIKVEKSGYTTIYRDTYLYPSTPTYFDIEWEITQTCNGHVYDHVGDAISSATVKLIRISDSAVLESGTTNVNGYYSFSEDVQENLYCKIQVEKTNYETHYITMNCDEQTTYTTFRIADTTVDKIAVFFYATDAITYEYISIYGDQLEEEEGFGIILYYENTSSWRINMAYLDSIENSDDFVFIHIMTHGNYDEEEDDSYCRMQDPADPGDPDIMYSSDFATYLGYLESENIFVLVGSCHSGGFVDDLEGSNRFIISTTDHDHDSYPYTQNIPNCEPCFEHYFFSRISQGYGDYSSYTYAETQTESAHPLQDPMYDNEISYTWFEWW